VLKTGESEIVVKKSRFLGYCMPVSDESSAQEEIARIRKIHYDARHCCHAYRLAASGISRSSDGGEPSGTAGAPILNVLNGAGVENALIAVVRYFGGVLLGTGGLARAYGKAASEALAASEIARMRVCRRMRVALPYPAYSLIEPAVRTKGYRCEADFGERVTLSLLLPEEEADAFCLDIADRSEGRAGIETLEKLLVAYAASADERKNKPGARE
jgi:uncharacterized YigZ family protein